MVPPALFEVVENISQRIFDHLKGDGGEHEQLNIPADESFEEPSQKVSNSKEVKEGMVETTPVDRTVLTIRNFIVVDE